MNSTILAIVCWNCWASLAIGLFFNGILLYLVIKHSTEELRHFGKVLVYYCVVNTATLLLQAFTQPIFFTGIDGRSFIFFAGPAASISPSPIWRHIFFSCYFSSFMLILASLTLQFLERYLVLCRSSTKHNLRRFLLSIFQKVFLAVSILLDICIYPSKEYSIGEVLPRGFVDGMAGEGLKIAAELDLQNASTELAFAAFAISLFVAYLIIVICYSRIRKFIKRNMASSNPNGGMSISNRDSSRQIVVNMFFQALLPIYSIGIYLMNIGCILGSQSQPWLVHLQMLTFVPINWLPLLNPLATMLTIRSYRNVLLRMCRWHVEPSSSVNMLKATVIGGQIGQANNSRSLAKIQT